MEQFDLFMQAPVEQAIIAPKVVSHIMVIEEIAVGDPARAQGYLGKYRGKWVHLMVPSRAFERYTELQKSDMKERLRNYLESSFV